MVTFRAVVGPGIGYFLNSSSCRRRNRLGVCCFWASFSFTCSCTPAALGSPSTSPRSHRLLVTQELPVEKVTMVRLQWLAQKGQGELADWV